MQKMMDGAEMGQETIDEVLEGIRDRLAQDPVFLEDLQFLLKRADNKAVEKTPSSLPDDQRQVINALAKTLGTLEGTTVKLTHATDLLNKILTDVAELDAKVEASPRGVLISPTGDNARQGSKFIPWGLVERENYLLNAIEGISQPSQGAAIG